MGQEGYSSSALAGGDKPFVGDQRGGERRLRRPLYGDLRGFDQRPLVVKTSVQGS